MVSQSINIVVHHRPKLLLARVGFYTGYMRIENKFLFLDLSSSPASCNPFGAGWLVCAQACAPDVGLWRKPVQPMHFPWSLQAVM